MATLINLSWKHFWRFEKWTQHCFYFVLMTETTFIPNIFAAASLCYGCSVIQESPGSLWSRAGCLFKPDSRIFELHHQLKPKLHLKMKSFIDGICLLDNQLCDHLELCVCVCSINQQAPDRQEVYNFKVTMTTSVWPHEWRVLGVVEPFF